MADQVIELPPLKRDLQTLAKVLYHVGQGKRFSPAQVNELDVLISGWDPGALVTLSSYWPGGHEVIPENTSLYTLLNNFATIAYHSVVYLIEKCRYGIILVEMFRIFRSRADTLIPLSNKMAIGKVSKNLCTEQGALVIIDQDNCFEALTNYFSPTLAYQDPETKQRFLQNLLPDALIIDEGTIQQLYAAKNGKRLHKLVIDSRPLSLGSWREFGEVSAKVADFFAQVNTLQIDPTMQSANRLPVIRQDIRDLEARVTAAVDGTNPDVRLEEVVVLEEEVRDTELLIQGLYAQGFEYTIPTMGVDRAQISLWKQNLLKCKKSIETSLKTKQKRLDATAELYQRNIKTKALPDITENTWARFWSIWTSESLNYQTDQQKISVIRAKLVDSTDRSIIEPMTN